MARYIIKTVATPGQQPLALLVPFSPTSTLAELTTEVIKRINQNSTTVISHNATFTIRFQSITGPILAAQDQLADIVRDGEELYFQPGGQSEQNDVVDEAKPVQQPTTELTFRIITPMTAKTSSDPKNFPQANIQDDQTIEQLHDYICDALGISVIQGRSQIDMHTHEMPIDNSAFPNTISTTGLQDLAGEDGIINLFIVQRSSSYEAQATTIGSGLGDVFRVQDYWQPFQAGGQSDRGMAMLLSTLRVFTQLAKQHKLRESYQAAILNVWTSLCKFLPAVRSLHLLVQGRKPTKAECATLSATIFEVLQDIVPMEFSSLRRLEGSRLLFGLVAEKARQMAQSETQLDIQLSDFKSITATSTTSLLKGQEQRVSTLSGLRTGDVYVFRGEPFPSVALTTPLPGELTDLNHLAGLCGQSSLAVYRPSTLASAVAPCLTFDEVGHVAVYTGREPCALPGKDMGLFRPHHGDSTPDVAVIEQALAPILQRYAAEGTDVFDVLGTPLARQFEAPDQIVMFCIDCSQSMVLPTEFLGPDTMAEDDDLVSLIDVNAFENATFTATKTALIGYEGYDDVLAAVKESQARHQRKVAVYMLQVISLMLFEELKKEKAEHERASRWMSSARRRQPGTSEFDRLQNFAAGLRTHEQELADFLLFRATAIDVPDNEGFWQVGHPIPRNSQGPRPLKLKDEVVDIPIDLRCPISYEALQDPVIAADGQTYSLRAITQWFDIRKSSPLTGLPLQSTDLRPNNERANEANAWIQAEDVIARDVISERTKRRRTNTAAVVNITFCSTSSTFGRAVPETLSLENLYKVAFRGMRGRHANFVLNHNGTRVMPTATTTVKAHGVPDNTVLQIVIFQEGESSQTSADACLVKVYGVSDDMLFGFWTSRWNTLTVRTLVIKYHRFNGRGKAPGVAEPHKIWANMARIGDGWVTGTPFAASATLTELFRLCTSRGTLSREDLLTPSTTLGNTQIPVYKVSARKLKKQEDSRLSRLEVLKQMFEALVNRMLAYSYRSHLGMITIATEARLTQALTHVIENFRSSVEGLEDRGDTALWDGLSLAKDRIVEYAAKYPTAKKRIICLSDGKDTSSTRSPSEVYAQLLQNDIVLDSICIGYEHDDNLKTMSYLLGSYCFKPEDMASALAICEMEPMLSLKERPDVTLPKTLGYTSQQQFLNAFHRARYTSVSRDVYPERKEHDRINDSFLELTAASAKRSSSTSAMARSNIRISRLLSEMQSIAQDPNPQYNCYISEVDMSFWKVVMKGPTDTPYENGVFLLYLDMPENYPAFPPKGRFITNMLHPNVNRHGRICHSIFDRDWTSDTSLTSVLNTIYGLLFQADYSDPVHTTVTLGYHHDQVEFADEVREHVAKHASKSAAEWREELTGEMLLGDVSDDEAVDEEEDEEEEEEEEEEEDEEEEEEEEEEDDP